MKQEDGLEIKCERCLRAATGFRVGGVFELCYRCWNAWLAIYGSDAAHRLAHDSAAFRGAER